MKLRLLNPLDRRPALVRLPLPGFDPIYYLYRYPDVRAAGLDPLRHYLLAGWKEGRDPSAGFSTVGYLAANPDVAASGHNPLLHFVNAGLAEGRDGFNKYSASSVPRSSYEEPLKLLPPPMLAQQNTTNLLGHVDVIDSQHIWGWAVQSLTSGIAVEVEILVNQFLAGRVVANIFRQDLKNKTIGSGYHGFSFAFAPHLRRDVTHDVVVRRFADKLELGRKVLHANG